MYSLPQIIDISALTEVLDSKISYSENESIVIISEIALALIETFPPPQGCAVVAHLTLETAGLWVIDEVISRVKKYCSHFQPFLALPETPFKERIQGPKLYPTKKRPLTKKNTLFTGRLTKSSPFN